jgi:uncharacterized coiled-coil DUF342 family protein
MTTDTDIAERARRRLRRDGISEDTKKTLPSRRQRNTVATRELRNEVEYLKGKLAAKIEAVEQLQKVRNQLAQDLSVKTEQVDALLQSNHELTIRLEAHEGKKPQKRIRLRRTRQ